MATRTLVSPIKPHKPAFGFSGFRPPFHGGRIIEYVSNYFDLMAGSVSLTQILVPLVSGLFLELSMTCGCQPYDRKVRCGGLLFI